MIKTKLKNLLFRIFFGNLLNVLKHSPLQNFDGHPKGQFQGVDRTLVIKVCFFVFFQFQHIKQLPFAKCEGFAGIFEFQKVLQSFIEIK